ncbi:ATP-binding protein [Nonomuraea sp. K274]|uniref:histidine kinase n=1 Tax=Nonomuraea cypriaca TaxID=1187855 RepID=A0A931F6K5_9ACTN|nr:ATP-binding protein [Nonomuraea cypriaca]MBF8193251.1 ATP-binding protein [Nonomuraea cypriaca]
MESQRAGSREAGRPPAGVARWEAGEARHPVPGTAQLPGLLRTVGLEVALDVEGERRPLPPAADLTVYRVVQEALTNTIRHANAGTATVTLTYETGAVTVRVDDDGDGSRAPRGHGLTGMAERVAAVGGLLTTGNGPTGGFRVTARLPA